MRTHPSTQSKVHDSITRLGLFVLAVHVLSPQGNARIPVRDSLDIGIEGLDADTQPLQGSNILLAPPLFQITEIVHRGERLREVDHG
jgi:hypothetical protein